MPATLIQPDSRERSRQEIAFSQGVPRTLDEFRQWAVTEAPEKGPRFTFVNGEFIADMSNESIESHVLLKGAISRCVARIVSDEDLGIYYPDGALISNQLGGVSNNPDATFASWDTLASGLLRPGVDRRGRERSNELEGTPDWVCEVVSGSSVRKDTKLLPAAYFAAGIPEMWLLDYQDNRQRFDVLVSGGAGYQKQAADAGGWVYSPTFGRKFRLVVGVDRLGGRRYELQAEADPQRRHKEPRTQ